MLKAGWHARTHKSDILKTIQGAETPCWALNSHICLTVSVLWAFSFSLSIYFLPLYPSLCMNTESPSLPQNGSDSCLARVERNLYYRSRRNDRACIKSKTCYPSVVMATGLGQPEPTYYILWPIWVSSGHVKIKLTDILLHHILQQMNWAVEMGHFTIPFSPQTVPTLPRGKQSKCQSVLRITR